MWVSWGEGEGEGRDVMYASSQAHTPTHSCTRGKGGYDSAHGCVGVCPPLSVSGWVEMGVGACMRACVRAVLFFVGGVVRVF